MRRLTFEDQGEFRYELASSADPVLEVEAGETVVVETEDAYLGQISEPGDTRDREEEPRSNPLSGPIAVDGAGAGDAVVVEIKEIRPTRGQASTYVPSWWSYLGSLADRETMEAFLEVEQENPATVLPIEDGRVRFGDDIELPYEPMIGTIATAPGAGSAPHGIAGPHGGNMDLPCLSPGSRITLPANRDGALLYVGDAHAVQGHGEITFVGAEMAAEVTLEVDVERGEAPSWPRIETDDALYAVAAKTPYNTLEDAIRLAYVNLANRLMDRGIEKWDAWQLCALRGSLVLGNLHAVAAGFPTAELG